LYELGGIRDNKTGKLYKLAKKSIDNAREMYQEAADKSCILAQNYLGCLSYNHDKDFSKAV
jgi:hypothetical protein